MARVPSMQTHFETAIWNSSTSYNFGTDWRGASEAPLVEGLSAELTCEVLTPDKYARRALNVHMMTAPEMAESLRPGGPPADVIGHLIWSKDHQITLWLPSDEAWWFITNAIRSGQFAKLSFTAEGPLRGRVKITHVYFSGDDESAEAMRIGRAIENMRAPEGDGLTEAELRRRLDAASRPKTRRTRAREPQLGEGENNVKRPRQ